jgi:hypothetical protein
MKYCVELDSGAMIYTASFINIGSDIRKLMGEGTHRQYGDRIRVILFFKNKESKLKIKCTSMKSK